MLSLQVNVAQTAQEASARIADYLRFFVFVVKAGGFPADERGLPRGAAGHRPQQGGKRFEPERGAARRARDEFTSVAELQRRRVPALRAFGQFGRSTQHVTMPERRTCPRR